MLVAREFNLKDWLALAQAVHGKWGLAPRLQLVVGRNQQCTEDRKQQRTQGAEQQRVG
jgi:hypothetical protein